MNIKGLMMVELVAILVIIATCFVGAIDGYKKRNSKIIQDTTSQQIETPKETPKEQITPEGQIIIADNGVLIFTNCDIDKILNSIAKYQEETSYKYISKTHTNVTSNETIVILKKY